MNLFFRRKPTHNPTLKWIFFKFRGVIEFKIRINNTEVSRINNMKPELAKIVSLLGAPYEKYYFWITILRNIGSNNSPQSTSILVVLTETPVVPCETPRTITVPGRISFAPGLTIFEISTSLIRTTPPDMKVVLFSAFQGGKPLR